MLNQSLRRHLYAAATLVAAAALTIPADADAAVFAGFQSRANVAADQECVGNYWSGVSNICARYIYTQAVATVTSAGNYYPNAYVYGDANTTLQVWGTNLTLDWIWTNGTGSHTTDYYGNAVWAGFTGIGATYAPASGGLLYQVHLAPNQRISNYSY